MNFRLRFTAAAKEQFDSLPASKRKKVQRALGFLQTNPRQNPFHPGQPVFEAYVGNRTGAHRVFWCYGPEQAQLTIVAITPHP